MRSRTIRRELWHIVVVTTLPMFIASALLLYQVHVEKRAAVERDAGATVRALMMAVDRDLAGAQAAAVVLATSPVLQADDLGRFRTQAMEVLPSIPGSNIVLTDASGQQVLNTLRPEGVSLPRHGDPDLVGRIFSTGKPAISDLYVGGVRRTPVISIDVPVIRGGKVAYDLSIGFFPERLADILGRERLPPGWIAAIFDSRGVIVARTHAAEQFVGRRGSPALIDRIAQASEGVVTTRTLEGIAVTSVFSRSTFSGWAVAIGVPTAELNAPQWRYLGWAAVYTLVLLACGLVAAHFTGIRLTRAVDMLGSMAPELGRGKPIEFRPSGVTEADVIARSLVEGASLLRERTAERDRELEQRLKVQIEWEVAEDAARARSAHFAYLSHELRSPLVAIRGFSDLIASHVGQTTRDESLVEYCHRINGGIEHVLGVIDDILDYARYEANEIEIHPESLDVAEEICGAIKLMEGQARTAGITLRDQITANLPVLHADRYRLRQILLNLLSNAVQFTPTGGAVTVSATMANAMQLTIRVEDNGVGISADDLARVMQPFKQAQGSPRANHTGTGLGLPLTKGLVELHGGSLILESAPGVGTVATVILPIVGIQKDHNGVAAGPPVVGNAAID